MKFFKPTLVAIALLSVMGCQESAKQEEKAIALDTEIYMERNLEELDKVGLSLDKAIIIRGFTDSMAGKSQIEKEDIQALLMNLDQAMKAKQREQAIASAEASLAEGQKFLEENAKKDDVQVTESGIQYVVLKAAEGEKPVATDTVKVHYKGTFINGEQFDSSYDRDQPAVFPLNGVIPGWTESVQLMSVGSKYKFTIPSDLAYGPNGKPPQVPGNSVLEFEIELLEIVKPEAAPQVGDQ